MPHLTLTHCGIYGKTGREFKKYYSSVTKAEAYMKTKIREKINKGYKKVIMDGTKLKYCWFAMCEID